MTGYSRRMCGAFLTALLILSWASVHAVAARADNSEIRELRPGPGRQAQLDVYSTAMGRVVRMTVLRAADPDAPAPVLYLLNGSSGGSDGNWLDRTDLAEFLAGEQVNVVVLMDGAGSYFTDWRADDPVLGKQRWATFLTRELPPLVDREFHGTGADAIAGVSMAGTSVFQLALSAPGFYRAIGSFSGCARTSDPTGQAIVETVVTTQRGTVANMWGPPDDPAWRANDPYLHAEELRGTAIYVSAGSGLPGVNENLGYTRGDAVQLIYQFLIGMPMEAIANTCTRQLQDRLRALGIAATFDLRPAGTHSWGYWQDDLHRSWPMFEEALR
ncbi:alpha/beta hydrolase [Nocardia aurantia]|uniref:Diacylglycerol acyltransferase/mycolyltransferase Ag85B n=1 Tax=Nocardia aurantia TaxID=2585199 RepID=A0A7K0DK36_9NOCA|nr:alpha/beta hydrolase family protein [Nocardia aurantia]MQY26008.1 Diacylglycerol acyltransferase/mycolyltransferase Ag85B [Nocardia aurantia]